MYYTCKCITLNCQSIWKIRYTHLYLLDILNYIVFSCLIVNRQLVQENIISHQFYSRLSIFSFSLFEKHITSDNKMFRLV